MSDIQPFHGLEIASGSVLYNGVPISLTGKEFRILENLMRHSPHPVTFADMLHHLYGGMDDPELRIVGIFGLKLGKKLHAATGGMISVAGHQGDRLSLWVFDADPPRFPEASALRA